MHKYYIGVMSGTSLDGIDVALCKITNCSCKLIHANTYPFTKNLKLEVLETIKTPKSVLQIGELDVKLGLLFAKAINKFLKKFNIAKSSVEAVGLHGQTLWHKPDTKLPFSMQLGSAGVVAAKTDLRCVADFRSLDIANGGQGAPFTPAFHKKLFSHLSQTTAVLNIGGMANITLIEKKLKGWDIGCGNVLLDYWIQTTHNKDYDLDGKFAASGEVYKELLESFLQDKYFKKAPPKSTGREYFNPLWLEKYLQRFQHLNDADVQRTLVELVAQSIANDLKHRDVKLLIVCGGGAKNSFLMKRIETLCRISVFTSDELGVSSDFMEAMAFAWLAYMRLHNKKVNLKSVTGAKRNSILGAIYG